MIVVDTNVLSELLKEKPDESVSGWADSIPLDDLWITTITIFEISYGLNIMDAGKRRSRLVSAFSRTLVDDFENRILDFNHESAIEAATIAGRLQSIGKTRDACDVQIAGIVSRFHATLATRNERHFVDTGVTIVNPWHFIP